jgi:hypothetical protein
VPSVNVDYNNEKGTKIKKRRGYVTDNIDTSRPPDEELVM